MDEKRFKQLFPFASKSSLALNRDAVKDTKLERGSSDVALATAQLQKEVAQRFYVRIISVRKRLLDEDNLCEKYLVDCLRYTKLIPDDRPDLVRIITTQRKCGKSEAEHTEIEITTEGE